MFVRRLCTLSAAAFHRGAADDGGLLAALRAELQYELSSPPPPPLHSQGHQDAILASGFAVEWDHPRAQDVLLRCRRRRAEEDEEVVVSALLSPLRFQGDDPLPRDALVKVCVKKPRFGSQVLRFDCRAFQKEAAAADFDVTNVCYHHLANGDIGVGKYLGPPFSSLDPKLQAALKDYLVTRGINSEMTGFLLQHLLQKEHTQYVTWLQTLECMFAKDQ